MARTSPPQPASSGADDPGSGVEAGGEAARIRALEARVAELEHMVQGLQDAVFRESHRHEKRIEELEARTEPAALAVALSKNARERGL